MEIVHKEATVNAAGSDDDFPGSFEVILSAPTKDRDGDTLLPEDWKMPLPARINFDSDHGMSVATTVGSGVPSIDPTTGNLLVKGTFSSLPRAQEVRTLVKEGHVDRTSVTFMSEPSTSKDGSSRKVRELLSGAFVALPSNREAVVLAAKTFNVIPKAGARNAKADAQMIQTVHDTAQALGATCPPEDPSDDEAAAKSAAELAARKSIVGSLEATQDRVNDALSDAYPNQWPCLRGTLATDGGGIVVFDLTTSEWTYERQTFKQTYTDDGSVVTLEGTPEPVDIMEIVVADADEDEDPALQVYTAGAKLPLRRKDADTSSDDDPGQLAQAVDAALDQAIDLFASVDATTLPAAVQQAISLIHAADASVDQLLAVLHVPDPDPDETKAARAAEIAPTAHAIGTKDAATTADADLLENWALKFTTYNNFVARKV